MNRTLKFRVWCNNQNCFEHVDLYKSNFNISKYSNPEIHQFTGLTDSYGNNIYENDIIEIEGSFQKWVIKYEIDKFIADTIGKNFILAKSNLSDFLNLNIYNSKVKIIGNIIENENLLKQGIDDNENVPSFVDLDALLENLSVNPEK